MFHTLEKSSKMQGSLRNYTRQKISEEDEDDQTEQNYIRNYQSNHSCQK